MEWSNENTLNLIKIYHERSVLWDTNHNEYKNKDVRQYTIVDIAEHFKTEAEEIKRKLKNIQSHFVRELKRERNSINYKSKWFAYKKLMFLADKKRKLDDFDVEDVNDNSNYAPENISKSQSSDEDIPQSKFHDLNTTSSFARASETSESYSPLPKIAKTYSLKTERDEFDIFGEQVAVKLRRLRSPQAKVMVQHLINITLFEAEMGKHDSFMIHHSDDGSQLATSTERRVHERSSNTSHSNRLSYNPDTVNSTTLYSSPTYSSHSEPASPNIKPTIIDPLEIE